MLDFYSLKAVTSGLILSSAVRQRAPGSPGNTKAWGWGTQEAEPRTMIFLSLVGKQNLVWKPPFGSEGEIKGYTPRDFKLNKKSHLRLPEMKFSPGGWCRNCVYPERLSLGPLAPVNLARGEVLAFVGLAYELGLFLFSSPPSLGTVNNLLWNVGGGRKGGVLPGTSDVSRMHVCLVCGLLGNLFMWIYMENG